MATFASFGRTDLGMIVGNSTIYGNIVMERRCSAVVDAAGDFKTIPFEHIEVTW